MSKIVCVAEQPRPGIEPYRIKVGDDGIECTHNFHVNGEGGTPPQEVGGNWTISYCPLENYCDANARLFDALGASLLVTGITCPQCHRTSYHPRDKEMGWCANCRAYTSPVDPLETAKRFLREAADRVKEQQPEGEK